jgi:hypothetical protein
VVCEVLTVNAPYPPCQANSRISGKVSCTHFETLGFQIAQSIRYGATLVEMRQYMDVIFGTTYN